MGNKEVLSPQTLSTQNSLVPPFIGIRLEGRKIGFAQVLVFRQLGFNSLPFVLMKQVVLFLEFAALLGKE